MKIIIKILIILICTNLLNAEYFLIEQVNSALAAKNIDNENYIILPDGIYKKNNYYELIYNFPKKIKNARIDNNIIQADQDTLILNKNKIIPKGTPNNIRPSAKNNIQNNFMLRKILTNILLIQDLDQDNIKEIIFKYNNKLFLGLIDNNIVSNYFSDGQNGISIKIITQKKSSQKLFVTYKNQKYVFKKKNNSWEEELLSQGALLNPEKLAKLDPEELEYLRFEILARHGQIFKNSRLQKLFEAQNWYKPNPNFSEKKISNIEKENIKLLYKMEGEKRRSLLKEPPKVILP